MLSFMLKWTLGDVTKKHLIDIQYCLLLFLFFFIFSPENRLWHFMQIVSWQVAWNAGVILELSEREKFCDNFREKYWSKFWISLYILYIFTLPSAQDREKSASWGRLFLPNCPLGWSLKCQSIFRKNTMNLLIAEFGQRVAKVNFPAYQ